MMLLWKQKLKEYIKPLTCILYYYHVPGSITYINEYIPPMFIYCVVVVMVTNKKQTSSHDVAMKTKLESVRTYVPKIQMGGIHSTSES